MELKDFIVTPIWLIILYGAGFFFRKKVTDNTTFSYFFPALTVKIIGAIAIGVVYQFYYYGQGDTFMFHHHGSRHIWEAFMDSPYTGLRLLMSSKDAYMPGVYKYASQIHFFHDPASYLVIKIAGVLDIFTFSTYSATAILFAAISFACTWCLFSVFYKLYPHLHRWLAAAIFFVPSVFFWSSGILKDTITTACIGAATYWFYRLFIERKISLFGIVCFCLSLYLIFEIRKFMLQVYIPSLIVWFFAIRLHYHRSIILKIMLVPFTVLVAAGTIYYSIVKIGENDPQYAISKIAETARITAHDIRYWTGKDAGSGYSLGKLDGTYSTMFKLMPEAINVSLFRPYMWEVNNPLMFFSALEGLLLLGFTIYVLIRRGFYVVSSFFNPDVIFTLTFSLAYAFAVGVSTFNFGSLARYKTPLIPLFMVALIIMLHDKKSNAPTKQA